LPGPQCEWSKADGWAAPSIEPYGNLSLAPSCIVFHYAIEVCAVFRCGAGDPQPGLEIGALRPIADL
jgi:hypothetical protein